MVQIRTLNIQAKKLQDGIEEFLYSKLEKDFYGTISKLQDNNLDRLHPKFWEICINFYLDNNIKTRLGYYGTFDVFDSADIYSIRAVMKITTDPIKMNDFFKILERIKSPGLGKEIVDFWIKLIKNYEDPSSRPVGNSRLLGECATASQLIELKKLNEQFDYNNVKQRALRHPTEWIVQDADMILSMKTRIEIFEKFNGGISELINCIKLFKLEPSVYSKRLTYLEMIQIYSTKNKLRIN